MKISPKFGFSILGVVAPFAFFGSALRMEAKIATSALSGLAPHAVTVIVDEATKRSSYLKEMNLRYSLSQIEAKHQKIQHSIESVFGKYCEADQKLNDFIKNKLGNGSLCWGMIAVKCRYVFPTIMDKGSNRLQYQALVFDCVSAQRSLTNTQRESDSQLIDFEQKIAILQAQLAELQEKKEQKC